MAFDIKKKLHELNQKIKKYSEEINVASGSLQNIYEFSKDPSIISGIVNVFGMASKYVKYVESMAPIDFVIKNNWKEFSDKTFCNIFYQCCSDQQNEFVVDNDYGSLIVKKFEHIMVGFYYEKRDNKISNIYSNHNDVGAILDIFSKKIKEKYNYSTVLVYNNENYWNKFFELNKDSDVISYHSEKSIAYGKKIQSFLDKGYNRSIVLYGPPGTGKTTFAYSVLEYLHFNSVRMRLEDFVGIKTAVLYNAFNILKPQAVIIDDFDRIENKNIFLELFQFLERNVPVTFVTVNNMQAFDLAIKRPGRLDEMELIEFLPEETVKITLTNKFIHYFDEVKKWPIAYIEEFVKRMTVDSSQDKVYIKEMIERQTDKPKVAPETKPKPQETVTEPVKVVYDATQVVPATDAVENVVETEEVKEPVVVTEKDLEEIKAVNVTDEVTKSYKIKKSFFF